jgi:hypothetical protein
MVGDAFRVADHEAADVRSWDVLSRFSKRAWPKMLQIR